MSGEVRLSDVEVTRLFDVWRAAGPNEASPLLVLATVNEILADRARLAAVPVPSETGLAERLARLIETETNAGYATVPLADLRALLSERTATTGGGGS